MNIMNVTYRGFRTTAREALLVAIGALFIGVLSGSALAAPIWENGEYLIYNSADLEVMADWVNGSTASADAKYRLMEDIDLDGIDVPWLPIGISTDISFKGELNGDGHAIRNFVIVRHANFIGLFGVVSVGTQISNLKAISFDVRGNRYVGGLVGCNEGTISASYSSGAVRGYEASGGLVGLNRGTISTSYASVAVSGNFYSGGLVGHNYNGTINNNYASGAVSGNIRVGGLVGWNYDEGTINSSYASGAVSGKEHVGGLVGRSDGTISASHAGGEVSGNLSIGGLVGDNFNGTINNSYAIGVVSGNERVGGLAGQNTGIINPSYWLQHVAANINTGLSGVGLDNNVMSTDVTSLDFAGMANRASFDAVSWKFYGDPSVTNPDWCYTSFDQNTAPAPFALFDPASAPDFDKISGNFIHGVFYGATFTALAWENGEYLIYTSADLKVMADGVNGSTISADAKYRLMEDLDLDGIDVPWLPIGISRTISFNGEFNGGGHAIHNFVIRRQASCIGLFSTISVNAQISDLKITSFDVSGYDCVGGLIGLNWGTISSCYTSGAVSGSTQVGGFAGWNDGTINTGYASGAVNGSQWVGGLVGWNRGTISTSYTRGSVNGRAQVGGLIGLNDNKGTISLSYASGAVSGSTAGGLVGANSSGTIITSYASGAVIGDRHIGGLVGSNSGTISASYASGSVSGEHEVGNLAGRSGGTISNSYASGMVNGIGAIRAYIGGFVGLNYGAINTSYASREIGGFRVIGGSSALNPDWYYASFDNGAAPVLLDFFDPVSAPDFDKISENFIHIITQSSDLHAGEREQLQVITPGFNDLIVQDFNLSALGLSGDNIIIERPGMYKAVISIDEHRVVTISSDSTFSGNMNVENITVSVDHKIGGYPQLQKSFSLLIVPDSTIYPIISITTQPINTAVTQGSISGSLSVTVNVTEGTALTYQWYSSTRSSNTGGTAISGATSTSFTIPTDLQTGKHYYYCVVSVPGVISVPSNAVLVKVDKDTGFECNVDNGILGFVMVGVAIFVLSKRQKRTNTMK